MQLASQPRTKLLQTAVKAQSGLSQKDQRILRWHETQLGICSKGKPTFKVRAFSPKECAFKWSTQRMPFSKRRLALKTKVASNEGPTMRDQGNVWVLACRSISPDQSCGRKAAKLRLGTVIELTSLARRP